MKFIYILLLLCCSQSYVSAGEMLPGGNTNEFHLAISDHHQPDADQPTTPRQSMAVMRQSIVKKITGISTLPDALLIAARVKNMPAPVIMSAGIHVKNYLRHIYPFMDYWS